MTGGVAALDATFVLVKPFLAHLLLNMDLTWELGLKAMEKLFTLG